MRNTGDVVREVKARGQETREPPTQRQGPPDESEGAEESADGPAVHLGGIRPHGAGPSPLAVWPDTGRGRTKSPATAHAGHEPNARACWRNGMQPGGTAVDAIAMETDAFRACALEIGAEVLRRVR